MRKFLLLQTFILLASGLWATQGPDSYYFDSLTLEDGLPNSSISSIQQDSRGFLWFGTQSGLSRYDGYSFQNFDHDTFNENSLPHELVQTLFIDEEDIVWAGTYSGLSRLDPRTGTFTNYEYSETDTRSISNSIVTAVVKDGKGRIWAATLDGLNRLDEEGGGFTRYFHDENDSRSLADSIVRSLLIDSSGRLWVGTLGGLDLYDENRDGFIHYGDFPSLYVMAILELDSSTLLVGTWDGGLTEFSTDTGRRINTTLKDNRIYTMERDPAGKIWVGTWGGGLFIYDGPENTSRHLSENEKSKYALKSDTIYSIFQDRSGTMWVGTNGGGICVSNPRKENYEFLSHDSSLPPHIAPGKINTIMEDRDGNLWFGIYNSGIDLFNSKTRSILNFSKDAQNHDLLLSNNIVTDLMEDSSGNIWIATNEGLDRWDRDKKATERVWLEKKTGEQPFYTYTSVLEDRSGIIWTGTHNSGLIRYDMKNDSAERFFRIPEDETTLSDNLIYDILERRNGEFWIATNKGLNLMDRETGRFTRFILDRKNPEGLSNNAVRVLLETRSGELWAGTGGGGINRYNDQDGTFSHITTKEGLSDDYIMSLTESSSGKVWAGTKRGLSVIDPLSGQISIINEDSGLSTLEFASGSYAGAEGELLFGTVDRIYRFTSEFENFQSSIDSIHIESMEAGGTEIPDIFLLNTPH